MLNDLMKNVSPKTAFVAGLIGGIMALCTVGFIVLLILMLSGGKFPTLKFGAAKPKPPAVTGVGAPAGEPISETVGLNVDDFKTCLESGRHAARVEEDYQEAIKAGAQGTPYSVVVAANGQTFPVNGALPVEDVKAIIDQALAIDANKPIPGGATDAAINYGALNETDHVRGDRNAPVKLIEYSDLECPFCKRFHPSAQQVMSQYADKVAWVYRHFPLDSLHSKARKEAEASECAAELGGNDVFWSYIDRLYEITPANNGFDSNLL